jgi:hypothetical protein
METNIMAADLKARVCGIGRVARARLLLIVTGEGFSPGLRMPNSAAAEIELAFAEFSVCAVLPIRQT